MAEDEPLDLDEDLFDFDELLRDVELLDEEAADVRPLVPQQPDPPAPLPAARAGEAAATTFTPQRRPAPVAPRPLAAPPAPPQAAAALAADEKPDDAQARAPRRLVLSRGVALALSGIAALNLILLAVAVHALGSVRGMVNEVGDQVASSSQSVREQAEGIARTFDQAARPVVAPRAEGAAALERARELAQRGETQRARETLYALLAVADRLPASTRRDVEARARFLVADTWRLEAELAEALGETPVAPTSQAEEDPR